MFEACKKIKQIMDKFGLPWFIAGGWAVDLFNGHETRVHDDIEIGIFRKDQMKLFRYFSRMKKYYIDNRNSAGKHEKKIWNKEYLRLPIHEILVEIDAIELDVLLNERNNNQWLYRRNEKFSRDLKSIILVNEERIPYLFPEIVILYKSKNMREKDLNDIKSVAAKLKIEQIEWLLSSIEDAEIRDKIKNLTIAST